MIRRVWGEWTTREDADAYEKLLPTEIFSGIAKRSIQGYRGIHLLRRDVDDGVESMTIMPLSYCGSPLPLEYPICSPTIPLTGWMLDRYPTSGAVVV